VPGQAGDFLDADPWWLIRLTNVVLSSRGVRPSPMPDAAQMRLNIFRTFPAFSAAPRWLVNTSSVSCQPSPAASRSPAWLSDQAAGLAPDPV
jgi:hypothetical protein